MVRQCHARTTTTGTPWQFRTTRWLRGRARETPQLHRHLGLHTPFRPGDPRRRTSNRPRPAHHIPSDATPHRHGGTTGMPHHAPVRHPCGHTGEVVTHMDPADGRPGTGPTCTPLASSQRTTTQLGRFCTGTRAPRLAQDERAAPGGGSRRAPHPGAESMATRPVQVQSAHVHTPTQLACAPAICHQQRGLSRPRRPPAPHEGCPGCICPRQRGHASRRP